MYGEQQAAYPNYTSYSTPNPNPLQSHSVLDPEPLVRTSGTDPHSPGFNGLEDPPGGAPSGMISQTTDSATNENANATSTTMQSSGNFSVATEHVMTDATVTTKESENIQPIRCEACNITCNSEDVLEKHKQGKKHLKNLQKIAISSVIESKMAQPPPASAPVVGGLENKKHKLLKNGASANSLIYCNICDVVCNNQEVFGKHLAGKKHFAKATIRLAKMNGLPNPAPECSAPAAQPNIDSKPNTRLFKCELCNVNCTSNELLDKHLAGKKHAKKLKESEKIPDSSLNPTETPEGKMVISSEGEKPASCDICGITCNTYDVLKTHISGKKHQKNLEKSKTLIGPNPAPGTETPAAPQIIGPVQVSAGDEGKTVISEGKKRKSKKSGAKDADLETKKQRVLEGGVASDALRTCTVCNVVCNSQAVFITHLAGQKHAAMAVKQAKAEAETGATGAVAEAEAEAGATGGEAEGGVTGAET